LTHKLFIEGTSAKIKVEIIESSLDL
jgi:hypothetical protein